MNSDKIKDKSATESHGNTPHLPLQGEEQAQRRGATGMGMVISGGCAEDGKMIINLCLSAFICG